MPSRKPSSDLSTPQLKADAGALGEELVARWLKQQGWVILERRWHCRWGELDLVIGQPLPGSDRFGMVAFVEVKTRRDRNWDENGKLAITHQKQQKLWKTAQSFFLVNSSLADLPCRFDVALVSCEKLSGTVDLSDVNGVTVLISRGYRFTLFEYIDGAFTLD